MAGLLTGIQPFLQSPALMRVTIDIPDDTLRAFKINAAREGTTIRALVLSGIEKILPLEALKLAKGSTGKAKGKFKWPAIPSRRRGKLKLGPEGVYEYITFP